MRLSRITGGIIAAAIVTLGLLAADAPAVAQRGDRYANMSCGELWYERNAIYAEAGHCFETARARREFGRGCFAPYGRLNRGQAAQVARIQRWERRRGCR